MTAAKTFECDIESIKNVRHWIVDVLSAQNLPEDVVNDLALAANEAVTNSVVHGYAETGHGRVDLSVQLSNGFVSLTIRDYGCGLGGKYYAPPDTRIPLEGGYGIYLLHSLMDEFRVLSLDEGIEVQMKKILKPNTSL